MKVISEFLLKVLVKQFYIINAGFLLFGFFVFFGMINGAQLISYHRSLIQAMITSPGFMLVVWVAWLLYNFKCILFCINTIKATDSTYIYILKAVPAKTQLVLYGFIALLQYLPVLTYAVFVVGMALSRQMWLTALLVAAYQVLMLVLAANILFNTINKNSVASVADKISGALNKLPRPNIGYYGFLPGYLLHSKKIALVGVKVFSLALLSVSFVINGDKFDEDLFSIFFQLIFIAHAVLVLYCVSFAEALMQFSRNLPLGLYKIAGMYLFTFGLLLLPEAVFLLINNHGNIPVPQVFILYFTAVGTLFLYTAFLYACRLNMEGYMVLLFATFLMLFFLQKTEWHLLIMLAVLGTALLVFKSSYYKFERE